MTHHIAAGPLAWGGLLAVLAVMIVVDLRVGSAQRSMTVRTAALWSGIWIALAIAFGAGLWLAEGGGAGEAYFAGYVMEKALSLDNVFVFTLIFSALAVPREEQPRVLLWGILIALVLRAIFIFASTGLITIGLILLGAIVLFQLVTLPVEFDASRRALVALQSQGLLAEEEVPGARKVLNAAALTYVAAFVAALGQFIYLFLASRD